MCIRDRLNWRNLKKAMNANNLNTKNLVLPEQVHGKDIEIIKDAFKKVIAKKDGLITKNKSIFLGVVSADCVPLVFYSSKNKEIGVIHAGYKGILKGILDNVTDYFKLNNKSLKDIKVLIGPSIGVCCYEVSKETINEFDRVFLGMENIYQKKGNKYFLDLKLSLIHI